MRRAILPAFVVFTLWFLVQPGSLAQQAPEVLRASEPLTIHATSVSALRMWDRFVTEAERSGALRFRSSERDPFLPGRVLERLQQFHRGIRVWGAEIVRQVENGVPISLFGHLYEGFDVSVEPIVSTDTAIEVAERAGGGLRTSRESPELVVLPLNGTFRLAYVIGIARPDLHVIRCFVDANDARLLDSYDDTHTQAAVGIGRGVLGDQKKISTELIAGAFRTNDLLRPPMVRTYDMRNDLLAAFNVLTGRRSLSTTDIATDSDNVWTDSAVVDGHVHAGWTYDYFFKRFGRRGLDDRNVGHATLINIARQNDIFAFGNDLPDFFIGAAYLPDVRWMFFGSGLPGGVTYRGRIVRPLAGALDVVAHELTHGITSHSSRLIYRDESGALNEAFSDIMATAVEWFHYPRAGTGTQEWDYLMGEDVFVPGGIRSLENPALYGNPDHYSRRYTGREDNGGVHINSGIASHAFYLAIEGGRNRTSGITVQGVGRNNREQIENVFYRAFTLLMPPSSTFVTARMATARAAQDLYGAGGAVEHAVTQAWSAVGVFPATVLDISFTPNPAIATRQCQFGTVPCWKLTVTVRETGGQGFTVDRVTAFDYDDARRQLYPGWTFNFPPYFSGCGGGRARIEAGGQACVNWEWHLSGRTSGYTEFVFEGRSDDGSRRTFRNSLRLAP